MRKSSSTWVMYGIPSLFFATHSIAEEKASNMAQEIEQPIGSVVS